MVESYYPSVEEIQGERQFRGRFLLYLLVGVTLLIAGIVGALAYFFPSIPPAAYGFVGLAAFICLVVPVVIWNNPITGLYILLGCVILCGETHQRLTTPTSYIWFWTNMSTIGAGYGTSALSSLVFSPAEVVMVLTTLSFVVRAIAKREFHLHRGAFFWGIAAYTAMVFFGWVHGVTSGGDNTMALYEVRAQAHFLLGYLLGANIVTHRDQIRTLLWVAVIASGILAICSVLTFFTLPGPVGSEGFLVHDDSLFFNLLCFIAILAGVARIDRRLTIWASILTPIGIFAMLANQRRASIAAFIIALIPLLPILYMILKERRPQILTFGVVMAFFIAIYMPLAWNSEGPWALPARAIKSQSQPDGRDASSDYYRLAESTNLKFTRDTSPWIGIGYGKPFIQMVALISLTTDFLQYMPHNSVLWVWMRIGHIGFFCFLMMFAVVFIRGMEILKELRDPLLKVIGVLGMMYMLMVFTFGKYDMLLVNPRQMFIAAVLIGILASARRLDTPEPTEEQEGLKTIQPPLHASF